MTTGPMMRVEVHILGARFVVTVRPHSRPHRGVDVGHWPNRDVHGPDELQAMVDETRTMLRDLRFEVEVEPFVGRDLVAARWIGTGATADGPARFTGNDILRFAGGRFVEYWTGTSTG